MPHSCASIEVLAGVLVSLTDDEWMDLLHDVVRLSTPREQPCIASRVLQFLQESSVRIGSPQLRNHSIPFPIQPSRTLVPKPPPMPPPKYLLPPQGSTTEVLPSSAVRKSGQTSQHDVKKQIGVFVPMHHQGEQTDVFFQSLPTDTFLPWEEELIESLDKVLKKCKAGRSRKPLSSIQDHPKTAPVLANHLPPSVSFTDWIRIRVGQKYEVFDDGPKSEVGKRELSGQELEEWKSQRNACVEDFFAGLPPDAFTPDEENLRAAILDILLAWRGDMPLTLHEVGQHPTVMQFRHLALPRGVFLNEWIGVRLGNDIEVELLDDTCCAYAVGLVGQLDKWEMRDSSSFRSLRDRKKRRVFE